MDVTTTSKTIYDLGLHEVLLDMSSRTTIIRVPGGWIYKTWGDDLMSAVFVPWDEEFQGGNEGRL